MVVGLDKFREYFREHSGNYIIIGGTACDIIIGTAGFTPRRTKDIDIILIVEALNPEFVKQFWKFIQDGNYERKEKSEDERKYYRFLHPRTDGFPAQIELFSRIPDLLDIEESSHLTPIPVGDDLSSLSAILMDEEYYRFTLSGCTMEDDVQRANTETLICLKARAFLDLRQRKQAGENIDDKHIRKHKTDIFRLALLLTGNDVFDLPVTVRKDLHEFVAIIKNELPDKSIFKEMGAGNVDVSELFSRLLNNFELNKETSKDMSIDKRLELLDKSLKSVAKTVVYSPQVATNVFKNIYAPLIQRSDEELKRFDRFFKTAKWRGVVKPKESYLSDFVLNLTTGALPVDELLTIKSKELENNDDSNLKVVKHFYKFNDEDESFETVVYFNISFEKKYFTINVFIGSPEKYNFLIRSLEELRNINREEPIKTFIEADIATIRYNQSVTQDEINSWAHRIAELTYEQITRDNEKMQKRKKDEENKINGDK
ncbi:MAG TPA: hypothetical protein PLR45_06465 [Flavobacteriales bacterium]|nr:hypothetical protein [Flavobacteriales bacterium]